MKISILGSGAMGMLFGGYLSKAHEVMLLDVDKSRVDTVNESGITILERDGSVTTAAPRAAVSPEGLGAADLVILFVKAGTYDQAKFMADRVPGWKIFADVRADHGIPSVTMEQLTQLGFKCASTHYALKAAMEGMLQHGLANFRDQSVAYTFTHAPATGIMTCRATSSFDPQGYMELESSFTGKDREYTIVGHKVESEGFVRPDIKHRL